MEPRACIYCEGEAANEEAFVWRGKFCRGMLLCLRTCIHNRLTQSGQVFSRPAALKNLAIHQVLLRFFALQGGKIPCPAGIIRL